MLEGTKLKTKHIRIGLPQFLLLCLFLAGCSPACAPIDSDKASKFKSGVSLSEIEAELGTHHPATSKQKNALSGTIDRMPEQIKANAVADRTVAWGNDEAFVVGKVNDEGVVWVFSWRQGGERPARQIPNGP